jgi:hypothetical protein
MFDVRNEFLMQERKKKRAGLGLIGLGYTNRVGSKDNPVSYTK